MLKIKGTQSEDNKIELEKYEDRIRVLIDGCMVAVFWDDGKFEFYGQGWPMRHEGKWDE